jgi:hypothetical protein
MKEIRLNRKDGMFHGYRDAELRYERTVETKTSKKIVLKEREVSYRFELHQHPYVQQLTQRLLRHGVKGLLDADTDYVKGASLPGSVELSLPKGQELMVSKGSRFSLLGRMTITSGGTTIELSGDMELKFAAPDVPAVLSEEAGARLLDGLETPPLPGSPVTLSRKHDALLLGDIRAAVKASAPVTLYDGKTLHLPAGTEVLLAANRPVTLQAGTTGTLLKSERLPVLYGEFFQDAYHPTELVAMPYPVRDLDFSSGGAYAVYNWELFFHVPLTIAIHLSKNQRYAEAQQWFHYIFDPTDDSGDTSPDRFWKVKPFQSADVKKMEEILINLATGLDEHLRNETVNSIANWQNNPFQPHVIARYRQQAYMYKVVMAYLDNLIAWGDSLFRQDTGEAIDEALMIYMLAANILGPRPQAVPPKGSVRPKTYDNLKKDLRQFGTVLREVEADLPFDLMPFPGEASNGERLATVRSLGQSLYFGVPRNDKLLSYWDKVADRLFKIRNSLNFQGVFRQLALFEPPIDPALLARAAQANLDVGAIVSGIHQPLPITRFSFLIQKAAEIVQEVKTLGAHLLAAMEKEDGEALSVLRAKHERIILEMVEQVRYSQLQEAVKSREGLQKSLALAVQRYTFYERQLGKTMQEIEKVTGEAIAELGELDRESLQSMKFSMQEPDLAMREIDVDIASGIFAQVSGTLNGGKLLSSYEVREALLLEGAQLFSDIASGLNAASSFTSHVPQVEASVEPWGVGAATTYGGQQISSSLTGLANAARGIADRMNYEARRAGRIDSFARREREWAFQSNLAAGEINQIFRQLRAAQIREAIAEQELQSHRRQMKHAAEIEQFLNEAGAVKDGKQTNKALYAWMKREVKGLYAQCFQLAFDIAKKAERALQHELGQPEQTFIQYNYLAGKEGLLAGEKLYLDVKRMELAYHELNHREYELTKHVSLLQADPLALIQLRTTGRCTVRLPESLFDMDGPGHYFRRIKSVALSIPCVTGPYASVNCTLTLLTSSIRKSPTLKNGEYARVDAEDDRFSDYYGSLQSVVTSSAQHDSGLFETNLRDERYLPFENAGVISEWQLSLPADPSRNEPCQFDYNTISDVVLHIRYTAREGGELLRQAAIQQVRQQIKEAKLSGSIRLFSVRHEFPAEWAKFQSRTPEEGKRFALSIMLRPEHYPFWSAGRLNSVKGVYVAARSAQKEIPASLVIFAGEDKADTIPIGTLAKQDNLLRGPLASGYPEKPVGGLNLYFDHNELHDLWIAVTWSE